MENFKFVLFSIIVLGALGFAGYWAFSTIESGSYHVNKEKQEQMVKENEELKKENTELKKELSLLEEEKNTLELEVANNKEEPEVVEEEIPVKTTTTPTLSKTTTYKYQTLIDELQKLVNGNITLKNGSQGTAVGTIQKFVNVYNGTNNRVDNDFGSTTLSAIKKIQKDFGLKDDGVVGPGTMRKMIDWLKKK